MLGSTVSDFQFPLPVILLGAIVGTGYGLLAVGLVLVYRTSRVINFAHGQIGIFAAALLGVAVVRWHIPYYVALVLAFFVAAAIGGLTEVVVIRRLRSAPRVMSVVATLGVGQVLLLASSVVNPDFHAGKHFPVPPGLPVFNLGELRLTQAYVGMLVFGPIAVVCLAVFLNRSRVGIAMRCSSSNPEAARMAGIFAGRMSSLAWGIAGMMSALTAVLVVPSQGFAASASFGPSLLLRALTAAVIARMISLPIALAAGVGLGVVEQLLFWNYPRASLVDVALFVIILAVLITRRRIGGRDEGSEGSWAAVQAWRPLPEAVSSLRPLRVARWTTGAVGLLAAVLAPLLVNNSNTVVLTQILAFSIVGLSVLLITGLMGQLSLGQFAVGAVGAVISYHVVKRTDLFPLALLYAGLGGASASLVIGLPALRIKGLLLTVTTLAFGLMTTHWMLQQPWAFSRGVDPGRPRFLGQSLATAKPYYYFVLAILIVTIIVVRNVRNGGLGRLLIAIRDNEDGARAFTVPAQLVKLQGFVLAGFIAGLGGALYSHLLSQVSASAFTVDASINVVAMTLIGGTSLLVGPIIGAFYIIGIPAFLPLDSAGLASQQLGWLLLILYLPGGVAQGLEPARTRFVAWVTHRERDKLPRPALGEVASGSVRTELPTLAVSRVRRPPAGSVLLEGVDLRKRFGGVAAVDGVSMHVLEGEILGLIGPNGAGKTTTFEMLGGFIRPDDGRVIFEREDVSDLGPEERGQRGLIRSFQDAALFPTMTVLDVARLSFERVAPTRFLPSALGLRQGEQRKDRMARDLLGTMGLSAYANTTVEELSTGTRRIVEIACLIALQPALLLLDEPSSGIAQRETEALGELLRRMRDELQLTMLVIEHDIPLIMGLSDRIVAMDAGRVIATGTPLEIRSNPAVVEAYLGGAIDTVERSDVRAHNGAFPAIPGLSATRQAALLSTFGSVDELKKANVSDLMGVPGIGRTLAHRLVQALQ